MNDLGKLMIFAGALLAAGGAVLLLIGRFPGGTLPGDIVIERPGFTFVFPVVTCVVVSVVLSLILSWMGRR
jgi:hypothetical protein